MKLTRTFANRMVASTVALIVAASATLASAQSPTSGAAKVIRLTGLARYTTGDNKWHPLSEGDILQSGAVIQTASGSQVDLLLSDVGSNAEQPVRPALSYQPEAESRVNIVRL